MARELNRGEIWLFSFSPPDKRRPVLVLSRQIGSLDRNKMGQVRRALAIAAGCSS